jgi:acyl-CoA thioesterase-1
MWRFFKQISWMLLASTLSQPLLGVPQKAGASVTDAGTSANKVEPVIICLGDSLTEGYGVAKDAAYPALLEKDLKKSGWPAVQVINAGISGSTTASGLGRLRWQLKAFEKYLSEKRPLVLILALGANDGLRGLDLDQTKSNLQSIIDLARKHKIKVLLAGMQIPPNYGADYAKKFKHIFTDLSKNPDVTLLPFLLEGVAANPQLNQADGIHPNEKGHKIIAATVRQYLEPLLKQ